jgi:branched-subunit amino acid aminotransferase/4-amino-4-deoxychorismate lyase
MAIGKNCTSEMVVKNGFVRGITRYSLARFITGDKGCLQIEKSRRIDIAALEDFTGTPLF